MIATTAMAMETRVSDGDEGNCNGDNVGDGARVRTPRAMATARRVACYEEGECGKCDDNGKKGGEGATGAKVAGKGRWQRQQQQTKRQQRG